MSEIDESLFGEPHRNKQLRRNQAGRNTATSILKANAVVVSRAELNAMRSRSVIRTASDDKRDREAAEEAAKITKAKSRARKERMLAMGEAAKAKAKKSDIELAQLARERAIREAAEQKIDENSDMVKMLNTLGARAAAFTIRDQQLKEKEAQEEKAKEYDRRMDIVMEIDRITDLAQRDEIERAKLRRRVEDRKIITEQIEERIRQKLLADEAREQEKQVMLAKIRENEEEDRVKAVKRAEQVRLARIEVQEANENAIQMRLKMKEFEREEEQKILQYQAKKARAEAKREEEEMAKEHAKKEQQAKLLAQQERSQNKQAEIDELRARRAAEEHERRARNRELEEARKRREDLAELQIARKQQAEHRRQREERDRAADEGEYTAALKYARRVQEREDREAQAKHEKAMAHRQALFDQIEDNAQRRKSSQTNTWEEGRKLKMEFANERAKMEAIRDRMVIDMQKEGISDKYLSEMRAADIQKLQMR